MSDCTKASGTCDKCRAACRRKPGWFKLGEAEKVAEYLGLSLEDLFKTKLMVDFWVMRDSADVYVLSPAILENPPGQEFPFNPHGECVFYKDGLCGIHEVKPFECADALSCQIDKDQPDPHKAVMETWNTPDGQGQIEELLGRLPTLPPVGLGDALEFLGSLFRELGCSGSLL